MGIHITLIFFTGEKPKQGQRRDIQDVYEAVANGESIQSLCENGHAQIVNRCLKVLQLGEAKRQRTHTRDFMTEGIWIWGPSGCGKSHEAFKDFTHETHYVYSADNGWWDGYEGQETVICDDFRADLKFSMLLRLVDKYPMKVPRRHIGPASFLTKRLIITAIAPPEQVYANIDAYEKWEQFNRRFKIIEKKDREPEPEPDPESGEKEVPEASKSSPDVEDFSEVAGNTMTATSGTVEAYSAYDNDFCPSSGYD